MSGPDQRRRPSAGRPRGHAGRARPMLWIRSRFDLNALDGDRSVLRPAGKLDRVGALARTALGRRRSTEVPTRRAQSPLLSAEVLNGEPGASGDEADGDARRSGQALAPTELVSTPAPAHRDTARRTRCRCRRQVAAMSFSTTSFGLPQHTSTGTSSRPTSALEDGACAYHESGPEPAILEHGWTRRGQA
jgi:hypothetical protein